MLFQHIFFLKILQNLAHTINFLFYDKKWNVLSRIISSWYYTEITS